MLYFLTGAATLPWPAIVEMYRARKEVYGLPTAAVEGLKESEKPSKSACPLKASLFCLRTNEDCDSSLLPTCFLCSSRSYLVSTSFKGSAIIGPGFRYSAESSSSVECLLLCIRSLPVSSVPDVPSRLPTGCSGFVFCLY